MQTPVFYAPVRTCALDHAIAALQRKGVHFSSRPSAPVTHLLLPVPSFLPDGNLPGGDRLFDILPSLPAQIRIIGGNLPEISAYTTFDLLKDPLYTAKNAYITAQCALQIVLETLPTTLRGCECLVIGWGRIGKCIATLLRRMDARVTVAARKEEDRAILAALGYRAIDTGDILPESYRILINTAPAMILPQCTGDMIKIDLASTCGLGGGDVIHARGLPGKYAPEASGELIAETVFNYIRKEGYL